MVNNNPAQEVKYPKLWDKAYLVEQYLKKKKTIQQIAKENKCFWFTVKNALVKLGIERRRYTMTPKALKARARGGKNKGRSHDV